MHDTKLSLVRKCTHPGLPDVTSMTIADVIRAFEIAVESHPGLAATIGRT
jgi:hypothetical protein